ncbi:MAG: hypothetical protein U9Q06_00895 [Nanoarchaeota archaeon]|nr:hypothetical protein [Nanoarchaeota archaeon]
MLPKSHIVFGLIFSLTLLLIFPEIGFVGFFIIWASSVLIDVDHYLFYVWLKKDWSLKNSYRWFVIKYRKHRKLTRRQRIERVKHHGPIPCIFHGIETAIILIILSFFHQIFLFILIGILFHQFLDLIYSISFSSNFSHFGSQIYNYFKFKKKLAKTKH